MIDFVYWFDLLAVPGTLKSLLQHHSSKQSFLWYSLNLIVQLFHQYMTTGKTIFLVYGLCQQNDVLAFEYTVYVGHSFSSKEQVSFNFMAVVTVCSDFGAPPKIKSLTVSIVLHLFAMK